LPPSLPTASRPWVRIAPVKPQLPKLQVFVPLVRQPLLKVDRQPHCYEPRTCIRHITPFDATVIATCLFRSPLTILRALVFPDVKAGKEKVVLPARGCHLGGSETHTPFQSNDQGSTCVSPHCLSGISAGTQRRQTFFFPFHASQSLDNVHSQRVHLEILHAMHQTDVWSDCQFQRQTPLSPGGCVTVSAWKHGNVTPKVPSGRLGTWNLSKEPFCK
jgi:hypothetical protein